MVVRQTPVSVNSGTVRMTSLDVPGFRVDHAPYGGMKESGQGREGVRYAIEEMTELKLLVLGES